MRIALTIAGSDSGGGAGIQADLKTFQRFGVFGTSALTAITAQNTKGVSSWEAVSPDLVRAQIDSVAEDLPPAAFKSGMLASSSIASVVASSIRERSLPNYVLDPVMVATSGDVLLESDAIEVIRRELIPLAFLVTPNVHEAAILTGGAGISSRATEWWTYSTTETCAPSAPSVSTSGTLTAPVALYRRRSRPSSPPASRFTPRSGARSTTCTMPSRLHPGSGLVTGRSTTLPRIAEDAST